MNGLLICGILFAWFAILAGGWLCWQLLRQNGRILLRLDELEKHLDELESGGGAGPDELSVGIETPAFELPDLSGERKSLAQFQGQPLLLIFFNPECGFCREMVPRLAAVAAGFQPAVEGGILPLGRIILSTGPLESPKDSAPTQANSAGLEARLNGRQRCPPPQILILSTGDAEKNRQFFAEHKAGCPVLLQNDGEVAKAYQVNGTPAGYLVSAEGKIVSELAMGAEELLKLASQPAIESPLTPALSPSDGEREKNGGGEDGRANRFSQRSVARSKIKRDGLKTGTPAPDFRLPRLDGRGDLTLVDLKGKRVLLVFSSPDCGPCNALAPELEKFYRRNGKCERPPSPRPAAPEENRQKTLSRIEPLNLVGTRSYQNQMVVHGQGEPTPAVEVVMISKGEPKENRAKVKEHGLTFPIMLQNQWEISRRYAMFATPIAYLIDEAGIIVQDVAVGVDAIQQLMDQVKSLRTEMPAVA